MDTLRDPASLDTLFRWLKCNYMFCSMASLGCQRKNFCLIQLALQAT
jgi:hypothetical protein